MRVRRRALNACGVLLAGLGLAGACAFDESVREYLSARFWQPFAKRPASFERPHVRRTLLPYAGMADAEGDPAALVKLRAAYREISQPPSSSFDPAAQRQAVAAARADRSLTRRDREEVDLIDAKIEMRAGEPDDRSRLESAAEKLKRFLRTARYGELRSEARGWLAHIYYLLGDQTAAGKIYLDELNRDGSNLDRETLLNSLHMNYRYDGGDELLLHLDEYFDSAEHAAFAIQMVTNPHWHRGRESVRFERSPDEARVYARIKELVQRHSGLLHSNTGSRALALLAMRTALRMGDPAAARTIAAEVPADAAIRNEPDFQWMLASASFLARDYAGAEAPLVALFRSGRSSESHKAAAAYGLCGVYQRTGNAVEQIRYALRLHTGVRRAEWIAIPSGVADLSVYWAVSGWDLAVLLDSEAPLDALRDFAAANPGAADVRLVQYSLAVRLARQNRYEESAAVYESIHAVRRAPRMRRLAALYREANRNDLPGRRRDEAKFRLAEFLSANPDGIYFNDALWGGLQRYALRASGEYRLRGEERNRLVAGERKLKDDQEERWRAFLILNGIVRDTASATLRRDAAALAVRCLRRISDRFGREEEIRRADVRLSALLP